MSMNINAILSSYDGSNIEQFFQSKVDNTISVKQFRDNESLFLICNEYHLTSISDDTYRECRSFVVSLNDNILTLVSFTRESIINVELSKHTYVPDDEFEEVIEGTSIMVFNYGEKWHICTTRCTDIDKSFFNPNISFGTMFNECLSGLTREEFFSELNPHFCYEFQIVHHNNKHIIDYQDRFGPNYAILLTSIINRIDNGIVTRVPGHILDFQNPAKITPALLETNEYVSIMCIRKDESRNSYKYYNIMDKNYFLQCQRKPNYYNKYLCMLQIFLNNDKNYTITQYIDDNDIKADLIINGKKVDFVGMFTLIYKQTSQIIMKIVLHYTVFNFDKKSFTKINKEDYEMLKTPDHGMLRNAIASLQFLIRNGKIVTVDHIIYYLRKVYSPKNFTKLLKSIQLLRGQNIYTHTHNFYELYSNKLIEITN